MATKIQKTLQRKAIYNFPVFLATSPIFIDYYHSYPLEKIIKSLSSQTHPNIMISPLLTLNGVTISF